jgi:hypothetical protein
MHTILFSRGNFQYRQKLKKMQDGEIFLEDFIVSTDWKNNRVKIWAQLGDPESPSNPGPIDVTDWLDRAIQTHSHLHLASGHTLDSVGEVSIEHQLEPRGDGKVIPHGATATPIPHRIAAYNTNAQLSTEDATSTLHAVNLQQLRDIRQELEQLIDDTNERFKDWIEWVIGGTFDVETGQWHGPDEADQEAGLANSGAANQLNQLFELAKALNNDPNAFNTIMNRITAVDTILQDALAQLRDDMIAAFADLVQKMQEYALQTDLADLQASLNQTLAELQASLNQNLAELQASLTQDMNNYMLKSGGTFTGNVNMGSYILTVPTSSLP